MKFYLLLFILARKMSRAAKKNSAFKQFIRCKELKFAIKTRIGQKGRKYIFNNGRISWNNDLDDCRAAMVWCDGDTAFKVMSSGNDEAIVAALTEKKLTVEGNFKEFMWFARALELMTAKSLNKRRNTMGEPKLKTKDAPIGTEPFDKTWAVGESGMNKNPSPYDRVNRFRSFALGTKFFVDHQRACLVTEAYEAHGEKPQIIKTARALENVLKNVNICIHKDELIVGEMAAPLKSAPVFPEFSYDWIMDEIKHHPWKDRLHDNYAITRDSEKALRGIAPFWKGKTVEEAVTARLSDDEKKGSNLGKGLFLLNLYLFGGVGHLQPNHEKLFSLGISGIKDQVRKKIDVPGPHPGQRPEKKGVLPG